MKYTDLSINLGFHKNMQETHWLKLFPKWWSENDPLLQAIGKEIAYIKADGIFQLLNVTIKPPVMIWQESINHKKYTESFTIEKEKKDEETLYELIKLPAPLYKTYGTITLKNNSINDVTNLKIAFNETDYIIILDTITTDDIVVINVGSQKVYINKKEANILINGEGLSYFKTGQNKQKYTPEIVYNEIDNEVISYTITVPIDFDGKIRIVNNNRTELYDDFFDKEDIINNNDKKERIFYINNTEVNKNLNIKLYDSELYWDVKLKTPKTKIKYQNPKPLHNESINLLFNYNNISNINMDVDVVFDNAVFINEQNIEVHGLELIPIKSVNLYAYYDFPYNSAFNGWRKVYEKEYDPNTIVLYDMITTHFYTKQFYVEVFFENLDYPYVVGFPCEKNADEDSIYHINDNLDKWGEYFGLKRREYKTNIPEEDYPFTFPQFYPFDIEQDYWYYQRLINEYAWNDLAINQVDLLDINDNPIVRLHSIDPFIQDFVVYANSTYPKEKENIDYNIFIPNYANQDTIESEYKRMPYFDTQNLLRYDKNKAYVTLLNKTDTNITTQRYLSKPLRLFFDLKDLPSNIDIDDIFILVEAEATDNGIDKYSNAETGIIIPGIDENKVYKMIQSENYELEEKEIEYNLSDTIENIKNEIHQYDENIIHQAIIKPFKAKEGTYLKIPFILKENDELVNDITDVYVTYDGIKTYQGEYHSDKNGKYITVWLPVASRNYKTMSISCKSNVNNSFVAKDIPLATTIEKETVEDNTIEYTYIYGPIVDEQQKTMYVNDEWHTADLRNILQKDGIYFINTFENDNTKNTPTILLKNIRLKVRHKPKKSTFKLETQIIKNNVQAPSIAQLQVTITNTGSIPLQTKIDIVHATNLKIQPFTYINVDLGIGESNTTILDIIPEYPILDGQYDILTVCEDKTNYNSIILSANGLIQTGVNIGEHYGKYHEPITLQAEVTNINNFIIDDGASKILFFIDDFKVGESIIQNNKASITIQPSASKYLDAGIHMLEARFSGNDKFASSRTRTSLLISQNNTILDLTADDTIIYGKPYNIHTDIYSLTNDEKILINEGTVSFYLDNDKLGTVEVINGEASLFVNELKYLPQNHILTAIYNGTLTYAKVEVNKTITIIGGETTTTVFDVSAKPTDIVTLKAKVKNSIGSSVSNGQIVFKIKDGNNTIWTSSNIDINRGIASTEYYIDDNVLEDTNIKEYKIIAEYTDDTHTYQNSQGQGTLIVEKGEVIINNLNVFFGSQYEPLGFYLNIKDAKTNEPVTDGQIILSIPDLNIITPISDIDEDGGVRIIHNPTTITADEFNQLLNFYFKLGKTMPYRNDNNEIIPLLLDNEEPIDIFNNSDLYRIYNGDLEDLNLMDFRLGNPNNDENPNSLYYQLNSDSNADEQIYIGEDGHLYARTNIDPLRTYPKDGTFPINIDYISDVKYQNNNKQSLIRLNRSAIDVDVHSQNITYGDKEKSIICYVTEYNLGTDQTTTLINEGNVIFFIDDEEIYTSEVVNGLGVMSSNDILDVKYGKHLLMVEYISENKPTTYTYTNLTINPIISNINASLNREFKGQKSKLNVEIYISDQFIIPITGNVEVYLDDVLVGSTYLFGTEDLNGNVTLEYNEETHLSSVLLEFIVNMPDDIDITQHTLTINYSGDNHILPCNEKIILEEKKLPISIETKDIYVAQNEICHLELDIQGSDGGFINDGEIFVYQGLDNLKAKGFVKNNHTIIEWLITDEPSNNPYLYTIVYDNGTHYESPIESIEQNIYVIEAKDDVYIAQNEFNDEIPYEYTLPVFKTLQEALQCVKTDGNIYILDSVSVNDNITINKDVNIIGTNNALILKDLPNLLTNEIGTIQIYDYIDFNETIYEIIGLQKEHLNTTNFHITDTDLYFVNNDKLIPIFLLSDGKFYSYQQLSLSTIISSVSLTLNGNININNLHFTSIDNSNNNDFIIKIQKQVNMQKCILDDTIIVNNQDYLQLNTSLVYCNIVGSNFYDLNNNWWGNNEKPKYDVDSWIILKLDTNIDPPVIGDDIQIIAKLIGTNGFSYDLPSLNYHFESDSGYFSIETGKFIENTIRTTYVDGAEECIIQCIVDNEVLSLDILSYDRKTEVILDYAIDIPIGYQIPICAKVQSIADTYYKFNDNLEIIEQSNNINNGFCDFYIDDIKVGRAKVINGQAELPVYFSKQQYQINNEQIDQQELSLKVIYKPDDYYFKSEANKQINLINGNKVCFVSPNGSEDGIGTFDSPYDSIAKATATLKERIYLKEGIYEDTNIPVTRNRDIRRYNGECIFKDKNEIIFECAGSSGSGTTMSFKGLTFINNSGTYVIQNAPNLIVEECIFYNNNAILIKNRDSCIIKRCAIVNNKKRMLYIYNNTHTITQCWFGTNTPNEDLNEYEVLDNYIIMRFTTSRNPLYIGSVAHLTASLDHYYHNGQEILLEEKLPLRITKFSTTYGSLMPLKDYTYDNKSITFLDTNKKSDMDSIILTAYTNNNYITKPLVLKCDVKNIYDEPINEGQVKFKFTYNSDDIILFGDIIDGCATVEYQFPLNLGEYQLTCSYDKYSNISYFKVLKPEIIISSFNLDNGDYIYDMSFNMQITDSFNREHINQDVNIFIDDVFVAKERIVNSILTTHLTYDFIEAGSHILTITTEGLDSDYSIFTYNKKFIATKKNTYIKFDYNGLAVNEPTNLIIKVYDKDNRPVRNGNITIKYDNETIYVNKNSKYSIIETEYDNITLINGVATIYDFYSTEGQHSMVIYYTGDDTTYNYCLYTNNNFNVNLDKVIIESQELKDQLSVNIGQPFLLHFPITDIYNNLVQRGEVNLFLNNFGAIINDEPLQVKNGYVDFEGSLPIDTKAMSYDFIITYNDPLNKYISTTYYDTIVVHSIKTEILIDTIYTKPNSQTNINYSIESEYGSVMVGQIKAYFEDNLIGQGDVSDANSMITLNIPMLSAEETYHVRFEYNDTNQKTYSNSENNVPMIITKDKVNINVPYTEYYPHKNFNYPISVKDSNNNDITFGTIKLYIDNVETTVKEVINGEVIIPLSFDTVKDYNFNIVYVENEYYAHTVKQINFSVSNINLQDISLETMHSTPNQILETKLNIQAIDISTYDGFIDFYLDNEKIGAFSVIDKEDQYVKLNIPNISAGTHQMKFVFYNSSIFKDDEFIHDFIIDTQRIHLTVPESYTTVINDVINFDTTIQEKITGMLEYYLITIEDDVSNSRFIGIEQINNRNTIPFEYHLPNNLSQNANTEYYIGVKFIGNDQYLAQEKRFRLYITKYKPIFDYFNVPANIEYRSELNVLLKVIGFEDVDTIIYFYLNSEDNPIGYTTTNNLNDNGFIEFNYKLTSQYTPDTYTLIAVIKESTVLQKSTTYDSFDILPGTPSLNQTRINAKIGTTIELPTNVICRGVIVDNGDLIFTDDDNLDFAEEVSPGEKLLYTLDFNYQAEKQINVKFESYDELYDSFEDVITLNIEKNIINFNINNNKSVTRNTTTDKEIVITSPTIDNIGNINYNLYLEDEEVIYQDSKIFIPPTLPDKKTYTLKVVFDGNNLFYPKTQEFILVNQNKTIIDTTNISLEKAFDLVADYGTINITSYISDEEIDNDKNVTIIGNHHIMSNCNIHNTGVLSIQDLVFENSEDSVIKNDGELYVHNCTFRDNHAQYGAAIYVSNKNINTEVIGCTFTNNVAELYGGAIFSNQGNDVTIQSCVFGDNNNANVKGSSISSSGNMYISQNIFYDNIGTCEIYVISNTLEAEENYFDGKIKSIENKSTTICDLNYWGYNDQEDILANNVGIDINTWFISGYDIDYKEPALGDIHKIITPTINQYRNTLEKENLIYKNIIEANDLIPITIIEHPNETYYLNQEIDLSDNTITLMIGQEEFTIGD